ncbi:hypothetical protein PMAYCL1PPCAC_30743, partial [Pristionchus mayeri]
SIDSSLFPSLKPRGFPLTSSLIFSRMNFRTIFLFAIVGLLLVSSLDAAKAKGGKGKKGSAEVKSVEKVQKEKPVKAEKAVKVEKAVKAEKAPKVEKEVQVEKPQKAEKVEKAPEPAPVEEEAVVVEEAAVAGEAPTPKIYRPKTLKIITAYDKCKMECQKIRDQQDLHSYAAQLRDELAAAEAALEISAHLEEAHADAPVA